MSPRRGTDPRRGVFRLRRVALCRGAYAMTNNLQLIISLCRVIIDAYENTACINRNKSCRLRALCGEMRAE